MDFFGVGGWELLLISLIALLVLGPKQMILLSRKAGELIRKLQQQWREASGVLQQEISAIEEEAPGVADLQRDVQAIAAELTKEARTIDSAIAKETKAVADQVKALDQADPAGDGARRAAPSDETPSGDAAATAAPAPPTPTRYPAWTDSPEK